MSPDSQPDGLFGSVRRFFANLSAMLQTRLEILSLDIAEERFNLTRIVMVLLARAVLFSDRAVHGGAVFRIRSR